MSIIEPFLTSFQLKMQCFWLLRAGSGHPRSCPGWVFVEADVVVVGGIVVVGYVFIVVVAVVVWWGNSHMM